MRLRLDAGAVLVVDLGMDGIATCARLRASGLDAGILVVLPTDQAEARVQALDAGADDCLASPATWEELLARSKAIRRRVTRRQGDRLRAFGVELDIYGLRACRGHRALDLTRLESRLLEVFLRNPRQVLPRAVIIEHVWGDLAESRGNALEVYVCYLRRKLEAGGEPRLIQTVRGVGYAFLETGLAYTAARPKHEYRRQLSHQSNV
jgi:two-component system response regulator MprA